MKKLTLFLLINIITINSYSSNIDLKGLDSLFNNLNNNGLAMGSVSIAKSGKTIYNKIFGKIGNDVNGNEIKPNENTKYRIGNITETYTAVLILQLIEENKLNFSDKLSKYFKNIPNSNKITIEYLLWHSSGLFNINKYLEIDEWKSNQQNQNFILNKITNVKPEYLPNKDESYSPADYYLLALIIEKICNKPYSEVLNERIVKKLNLENTYSDTYSEIEKNEAKSFVKSKLKWIEAKESNLNNFIGSLSIVSSTSDIQCFLESLFSEKLLSIISLKKMLSIEENYGMGIKTKKINNKIGYEVISNLDKTFASFTYLPSENLTIVCCLNGNSFTPLLTDFIINFCDESNLNIPKCNYVSINSKQLNDKILKYGNVIIDSLKNDSFGMQVCVFKNDTFLKLNFGNAKPNKLVDGNTIFAVGSSSKLITSTLIFQAIEKKIIYLNQPISDFFKSKYLKNITIKNLLTHSSGLNEIVNDKNIGKIILKRALFKTNHKLVTNNLLKYITKPKKQPNIQFEYCNTNYILLAYILEKIYHKKYFKVLDDELLIPHKLDNVYSLTKVSDPNMSQPYSNNQNVSRFFCDEYYNNFTIGAGSLSANAFGFTNFLNKLFVEKSILSDSSIKNMEMFNNNPNFQYGMGLIQSNYRGINFYGHSGDHFGYASRNFYNSYDNTIITILYNTYTNPKIEILTENFIYNLYFE